MSHGPRHPSDESLLRALDGELTPRLSAALDVHLAGCEPCHRRLEAFRSSARAALGGYVDETAPGAPALTAMRARLRANLEERSAALDRSWRFQLTRQVATASPVALFAAATVVILFAGYVARHEIAGFARAYATAPLEPGALPIRALTPGATERVSADDLCAGRGPSKEAIPLAVRRAVLHDYGMEGLPETDYELDYLITPELGGSSDRRNLWPERYGSRVWNARVKDQLEVLLPRMVCEGRLELATAQRDIAADWIAAYRTYFHTDRPLPPQIGAFEDDDVARDKAKPLVALAQLTWR